VAQAKATTKEGQWGSVWCWKQAESLICDWVAIMFTQPGAQILDGNGKAVFNTKGGTEALQWMVDLLYTHKVADPASLEYDENAVKLALETGTVALTYNWEGVLPEANDPAKSKAAPNIKIDLLPGTKDVKSSSVNGSEGWAILKNSTNKDNAWKLLEYMASPAWQKKAAVIAGDYPILSSLYSDPDLEKQVQDFPLYGEQFKYLAVRPQVANYTQASDIIQKHIHEALLQQASPKDAMDAAADEINKATATKPSISSGSSWPAGRPIPPANALQATSTAKRASLDAGASRGGPSQHSNAVENVVQMRSAMERPDVLASTTKADSPLAPGASPLRANTT